MRKVFLYILVSIGALCLLQCSQRPKPQHPQPDDAAKAQARHIAYAMIDAHREGDGARLSAYFDDPWMLFESENSETAKSPSDAFGLFSNSIGTKAQCQVTAFSLYDLENGDDSLPAAVSEIGDKMRDGDILLDVSVCTDSGLSVSPSVAMLLILRKTDPIWRVVFARAITKDRQTGSPLEKANDAQ